MQINYPKICSGLLATLATRQREVISRRFGLTNSGEGETLEAIGKTLGVTRERVRQIERDGFLKLKPQLKQNQAIFDSFKQYLKSAGGAKREEIILADLGGKKWGSYVSFLLSLNPKDFQRFSETSDFYAVWTLDQNSLLKAQKTIASLVSRFEEINKPTKLKELLKVSGLSSNALVSFLEISKKIQENQEGFWGLVSWPEIKPRGVKDKAFLVFKKEKKPLHFREVAALIERSLPQTVHNELIKDNRFVLVGRGIYALKEWGYQDGFVKDVILNTLQTAGRPLNKNEILDQVLKQRMVKENTVLLNLSNKKYFARDPNGSYTIREA